MTCVLLVGNLFSVKILRFVYKVSSKYADLNHNINCKNEINDLDLH